MQRPSFLAAVSVSLWRTTWLVFLCLVALRLSWLSASLVLGWSNIQRHHVESNAFAFAALLLGPGALLRNSPQTPTPTRTELARPPGAVFICLFGVALYFPAISLGLFSDDFVLIRWATQFTLVPSSWSYFRPVPLGLWGLVANAAPYDTVAPLLHTLNIALHLANAILLMLLGLRLGLDRHRAFVSGLTFVVFPLSVEAVVWPSALPDVALTTVVLLAAILSLRSPTHSVCSPLSAVALTLLALGIKETAVALPVIVAGCLFATHADSRRYRVPILSAIAVVAYLAIRIWIGDVTRQIPSGISGYQIKELVSRPFAALVLPFHEGLLTTSAGAAAIYAASLPLLFARAASGWQQNPAGARRALAYVLCVLAGVAPLLTLLFVGSDLQGSRYLYLSTAPWALLLAEVLPRVSGRPTAPAVAVTAVLVAWFGIAAHAHLQNWVAAAQRREDTLVNITRQVPECSGVTPRRFAVPSTYRGAYVFLNGLSEALLANGIENVPGPTGSVVIGPCTFVPSREPSE